MESNMGKPDRYVGASTAEGIAFYRALENHFPPSIRIYDDPYAKYFLSDAALDLLNEPAWLKTTGARAAREVPGVNGAIAIRVRFFDDYLNQCLSEGFSQIVLLGAGYDTRAYRFGEVRRRAKVYELEHPDIQGHKISILKQLFQPLPTHVSFIPINFNSESFGSKLIDAGFKTDQPALFIWEGVTMYLLDDSVNATLNFVSRKCAAGSRIIFDYFPPTMVNGTCSLPEAQGLTQRVNAMGEVFRFGLDSNRLGDFLQSRGLKVVLNINANKLKERYFKDSTVPRPVSSLFSFAVAEAQQEKGRLI